MPNVIHRYVTFLWYPYRKPSNFQFPCVQLFLRAQSTTIAALCSQQANTRRQFLSVRAGRCHRHLLEAAIRTNAACQRVLGQLYVPRLFIVQGQSKNEWSTVQWVFNTWIRHFNVNKAVLFACQSEQMKTKIGASVQHISFSQGRVNNIIHRIFPTAHSGMTSPNIV